MELRRVEIADILAARDARVSRQRALLDAHRAPLISFTMNIAGAIKRDARIEAAFDEGLRRIKRTLEGHRAATLWHEEKRAFTGCEALWVVAVPAGRLKRWMCAIEEADLLGRLFDIDVIDADGSKRERERPRTCLICGNVAAACARSRTHSAEALYERARQIIAEWYENSRAERISELALRALCYEALVTPKPGLVDRADSGAHSDMDIFSFAASAAALGGYFRRCALLGARDGEADLEGLRFLGLCAEERMLRATAGANTHKGAIFSLGILCCAAMRASDTTSLFARAAEIAAPLLNELSELQPEDARTGGEKQYLSLGLTGARGEAAAGFPTLRELALPRLKAYLRDGLDINSVGQRLLAALMARVEDSNVLRRADMAALRRLQARAAEASKAEDIEAALREMNDSCIRENISPGGSADLLAAAFFVYYWELEEKELCLQD